MIPPIESGDDRARRLRDLTVEWLERCEQDKEPDLAELCHGEPELVSDLRQNIEALRKLNAWLDADADADGVASRPAGEDVPEESPSRVDRYRIVRELGRGGMGVVHEAEQEPLGRRVAIKILRRSAIEHLAHRTRFLIEAQALALLDHPHIVKVYEFGHADGRDFIAMPFIDGRSLDKWLLDQTGEAPRDDKTRETSSPRKIARIGAEIADALASAHRKGVFHRDVKPSNILIDGNGNSWLVDFGLARIDGTDGPTRSGPMLGSVAYIAPERFEGVTDQRGDIYSLGVTLYEGLTSKRPFEGKSEAETISRILEGKAITPRKLDSRIPRDLETVVQKAIARDPSDRYASAANLADDLRRFLEGRPVTARPVPTMERFLRWHRRSPVLAVLVWALFVTLSSGLIMTTIFYREALRQRGAAEENERWARDALAEISELVAQDSFFTRSPTTEARAILLRKVQDYYEKVITEGDADRAARSYWALTCRRVAEIETALGHTDLATSNLKRSIEAYDSLIKDFPSENAYRFGLFHALLSCRVGGDARYPELEPFELAAPRRALETIRTLVEIEPKNADYRDCLAAQGLVWGVLLRAEGKTSEAEQTIRSAMATAKAVSEEVPSRPEFRKNLAGGWLELGRLFMDVGRREEALEAFQNSSRTYAETVARARKMTAIQYDWARSLGFQGNFLIRQGRSEEGVRSLKVAGSVIERLLKDQPDYRPYVEMRDEINRTLRDVGTKTKTIDSGSVGRPENDNR